MSTSYEIIDPSNLSEADLTRICSIEADMWAREEGLGTYMYCESCKKTYSKQNIYAQKVDKVLYAQTVFEIEEVTKKRLLKCQCCNLDLSPVFDSNEYLEDIRERFSSGAMLLLMQDDSGIVGFMDGHISDYDTIFRRDLSYRYPEGRKIEIAQAIESVLGGELPDKMFSCSSMGTTESYMHFKHIYGLLHNFFGNFPEKHEERVGISELNSGGSLDRIYKSLGSENIGIYAGEQNYITQSYSSGLFIQKNLGRVYKGAFGSTFRDFLRNRKTQTYNQNPKIGAQ